MAEYIDKNKLTRDLIDNRSFYPAIVKNAIENAPTADIVPRAEIIKEYQDRLLKKIRANQRYHGWYVRDKVIKEIAEEMLGEGK